LDTLLFVLIIKKRKWGWILLVVEHTYMIFINLTLYIEMLHFRFSVGLGLGLIIACISWFR
jgi:hypothetical protein